MNNYTYRFFEPGDEHKIVKLFSIVYGKSITLDWWYWRYASNPVEDIQIALAFDGDELIAHYAVSPTILSFGKKEIKSAQSMTTMTHPHYEGKGLFTRLASLLFEKLRRDGYESVYSFPNQSSHGIFINKLNFQDIGTVPTLILNDEGIHSIACEDEIYFKNFSEVDLRDNFEHNIKYQAQLSTDYLNWRFSIKSGNRYIFVSSEKSGLKDSFVIFKLYDEQSIDIVHMHGADENIIALVRGLINWSRLNDKSTLMIWCNIHATLHTALERLGFKFSGQVTYFIYLPLANSEITSQFNDWELNMSLSDLY